MNLIPPISANPMAPLPGNGLEPGDNPLAGIEGPIFYDEFIAALAKGAGDQGGLDLSGSSGEGVVPEGGSPESDLQGLPLEVTNQLIDQANFSPLAPTLVTPHLEIVGASSEVGSSAGLNPMVGSPILAATGSMQAGVAITQATVNAESAEATSGVSPKSLAAEAMPRPSSIPAPNVKVSADDALSSGAKPAIDASVVVKPGEAQELPVVRHAMSLAADVGQGEPQDPVSARPVDSIEAALETPVVAVRSIQQPTTSGASNDGAAQRLPVASETPTPSVLIQADFQEPGAESLRAVTALNPAARASGSMHTEFDTSPSAAAATPSISNFVGGTSVEPRLGPGVSVPQSIDSSASADVRTRLDWRGLMSSTGIVHQGPVASEAVGEGVNSETSVELSISPVASQASVVSEEFGGWRFKVRPNSSSPVEDLEPAAEVAPPSNQLAAVIAKTAADPLNIADMAAVDGILMVSESDLRRDPAVRSSSRVVTSDLASADVSRTHTDDSEPGVAAQPASAEVKAPTVSAKTDVVASKPDSVAASAPGDAGSGSGVSNSISEKFVSTLLGISGLQPQSAADRTTIEFRPSRTLTTAPHMARWDAAAVQVELVRLVRDGGGQIVMKLTPPDEGSFRIDLSIDADRGVRIFVDGASDSVRTRLEQGTDQLREQFSQMGFNLQLDMNGRRETSGQHVGFGFAESGDLSDSGEERNNSAASRADDDGPPSGPRRSAVDESRVYFRA